jgi:hypothetical protein
MARYKSVPAKGIYVPNATHLGYGRHMARSGDVILYRESEERYRLGRVLDLVTHDHDGKEYREATGRGKQTRRAPRLRVMAFNDVLTHVYERWVDVGDVVDCLAPQASARFLVWALTGPLPKPEVIVAAANYGTLSSTYFDQCADENGNLSEGWRERTNAHHDRVAAEQEARRVAMNAAKVQP